MNLLSRATESACHDRGAGSGEIAVLLLLLATSATLPQIVSSRAMAQDSNARAAPGSASSEDRRRMITEQIGRLDKELQSLTGTERGILGELNRIAAEIRLRAAEVEAIDAEIEAIGQKLEASQVELDRFTAQQAAVATRLKSRLRGLYVEGPLSTYRILFASNNATEVLRATRHANAIAAADASLAAAMRAAVSRIDLARQAMESDRERLVASRTAADEARRRLEMAQGGKERLLASVQRDRDSRIGALAELQRAGDSLSDLTRGLSREAGVPAMDFGRFRGLLDWPAAGKVSAGFGKVMHPRFHTVVPHDGLDIDAPQGADIRAVFDGRVAYAGWLAGYGLTLVLDHGRGYLTISAHASALLVEAGEAVRQGQVVAKVGDTGSLTGSLLYFEVRHEGRPLDPRLWLKPR